MALYGRVETVHDNWNGRARTSARWACQFTLGLALAWVPVAAQAAGEARPAAPAASAAFDYDNPPRIRLVRRSTEPFDLDFPTLYDLPKTLSVDPLTPAEILQIQTFVFNSIKPGPNPVPSYADRFAPCMQWIFIRRGPAEPWLTVGITRPSVVKINGKFRHANFFYRIPSRLEPGIELPGFAGTGSIQITGWMSSPTIAEMSRGAVSAHDAFGANVKARRVGSLFAARLLTTSHFTVEGRSGEPPSAWDRITKRSRLAVTGKTGPCTHMAGKCRRYVGIIDRESLYGFYKPGPDGSTQSSVGGEGDIEVEEGAYHAVAVEDFCPFTPGAMVQAPLNARAAGGSNMKEYAIGNNPSLRNALKPFVEGKKK